MSEPNPVESVHSTEIKVLGPGDEGALEAFLLPRVDTSMFLVGNMRAAGLLDRGHRYEGTYVAAFRSGEIHGVVAHYWNQNLVVQAPDLVGVLWPAAVKSSGRPVKGVLGPDDQVEIVKGALGIAESQAQMNETEILYSLPLQELIVPALLDSGRCRGRRAKHSDLELLTEWRVAFSLEGLGEHDSPALRDQCRTSIERATQDGHLWVLEFDGRPVATTALNAALQEAVQIGGVWTPPELRSRNFGRSVVAVSLLELRVEGVEKAILFTGSNNVPAQRAYLALGFRSIGHYRILLLRSALDFRDVNLQQ
jgi:ribosomal protein S18 acetylase RimI-like enzyme